jgi:hypothetical protein
VKEARRRGSAWVGIVVVAVFFACVTLAVASIGGGPDIPHPAAADRAACVTCHPGGRLPEDHHDRAGESCRSCHSEAPGN